MHALQAFILGIVEGITEFLPISSTAHLIIAAKALKLDPNNFIKSFEIIIQLGAILAVVVLYVKQIFRLEVIKRLVVAFIPTGVIGLILYKFVKSYLLGNLWIVLASLFVGGVLLILFERKHQEKEDAVEDLTKITYKQAVILGLCQAVAIVPGVSRSAATIVGGLMLGIKRKTIVEFSFLLAVPTMAAATLLDLAKNYKDFSSDQFSFLAVGFIAAFVTAILAIKFLLSYIRKHNFTVFGIYRIAIALVILAIVLIAR